jgi:glycosyltransferase involved in cell wall biosynthesis
VTFALFAYNQEQYIREAVLGAFSQTYEPLEIILSDDCSTDRTYEIMSEMAREYRGPHRVVLNRNDRNLGISSHVRHIHKASHGELVVHAAGDDISLPRRTAQLVSCFLTAAVRPMLISSLVECIDRSGEVVCISRSALNNDVSHHHGATFAVNRCLIDRFNDPIPGITAEDSVLVFRARLLGSIEQVNDTLVSYRLHDKNSSGREYGYVMSNRELIDYAARWSRDYCLRAQQCLLDLEKIGVRPDSQTSAMIMKLAQHKGRLDVLERGFVCSAVAMVRNCLNGSYCRDSILFFVARWLPWLRTLYVELRK